MDAKQKYLLERLRVAQNARSTYHESPLPPVLRAAERRIQAFWSRERKRHSLADKLRTMDADNVKQAIYFESAPVALNKLRAFEAKYAKGGR